MAAYAVVPTDVPVQVDTPGLNVPVQVNTPGLRGYLSRFSEASHYALAQQRPWAEFFDRHGFSKPDSLAEASGRIRKNVTFFRANYFISLLGVIVLSLIWHPSSLFVIAFLLAAWAFLFVYRSEPLVLFNRTFGEKEVLALMSVITVVVVFLLTDVGSLLISAVMFGFLIVCAHAAFRVPDDLFLDEQPSTGGFLSFLGGNVPQPATTPISHV